MAQLHSGQASDFRPLLSRSAVLLKHRQVAAVTLGIAYAVCYGIGVELRGANPSDINFVTSKRLQLVAFCVLAAGALFTAAVWLAATLSPLPRLAVLVPLAAVGPLFLLHSHGTDFADHG
jgi:hypothetical protein